MSKKMNWSGRVSGSGLRTACNCLGVKRPVKVQVATVRQESSRGVTRAAYTQDRSGAHRLLIDRSCTNEQANEAAWHELAHAAQVEHYGPDASVKLYDALEKAVGYDDNPFEVEARRWASGLCRSVQIVVT